MMFILNSRAVLYQFLPLFLVGYMEPVLISCPAHFIVILQHDTRKVMKRGLFVHLCKSSFDY